VTRFDPTSSTYAQPPPVVSGRLRRVLYVIGLNPSLKFGSLEEQIFCLARAFKEEGGLFLPLFQSPLGPEARAMYQAAGLEAECLSLDTFSIATLRRLMRLIRSHRIELLHWNFYRPVNLYIYSLTLLMPRLSYYLTDHNTRELPLPVPASGLRRLLKKALLRRYSRVFCISDFVLRCLEAEGVWPNTSACTYFINSNRFHRDDETRSRVRKEFDVVGRFVVLVVAQLVEWKGIDVLLRALTRLPVHIVAWIVGDGPDAERLKERSVTLRVEDRARFFGHQADVSRYMQGADCLICPTLWAEAVGLVNLEALACELPVIGSKVGGIPQFVADGRSGFLFPPGDDAELANRIRHLAENPEGCRRMGSEGRRVIIEQFSSEKRLGEYLDLYRSPARGEHYA
jgi:glycosyltransferase involved in cell wall biosynthesis